jgi:endonuclease/exonuclease/phosphatase family metal-dependent hydrolase
MDSESLSTATLAPYRTTRSRTSIAIYTPHAGNYHGVGAASARPPRREYNGHVPAIRYIVRLVMYHVAAVLPLVSCGPESTPPASQATGLIPGVVLLSYNVNFEQFSLDTVAAVAEAGAHVAFLQEVTPEWESALREHLAASYPTLLFSHAPAEGGMAVLSRFPARVVRTLPSPVGGFPATCVSVDTPMGRLNVLHAHLHPPLDENGLFTGYFTTGQARAAEMEAFLGCFDGVPDVVLGDLNEESGLAVSLLQARGFTDAASAFPPPKRTWSWSTPIGQLEGRPDHVFHTAGWVARGVAVPEAGGSDHRPLRVVLGRAP